MKTWRLLLAAALLNLCGALPAWGQTLTPALLQELQEGGYIIYMRHARTDWSQREMEMRNRETGVWNANDCATQRNLSEEGREDARRAGAAFRELRIPVATVIASRYCRTRETARLFHGEPTPADDLTPGVGKDPSAALLKRLAQAPRHGGNTLIVAHGTMLARATGLSGSEGEAYVFRPATGSAPYKLVARIKIDEWPNLPGSGKQGADPSSQPRRNQPAIEQVE